MKKAIIFGVSDFSKQMYWYLRNDTNRQVVCFCVDRAFLSQSSFEALPVIAFEEITSKYPTDEHEILIAVGYAKMNQIRQEIYFKCKAKGYSISSYFHSSSYISSNAQFGEGNIILEKCLIQPFTKIGDCNLIWYNVSIAHNATIGNFNTLAGSTSLSGYVSIGNNCFLGNQSMIFDHVKLRDYSLVGAGANVRHDTEPYSIIVPERSVILEGKRSIDFL